MTEMLKTFEEKGMKQRYRRWRGEVTITKFNGAGGPLPFARVIPRMSGM